jgi:UDP-glucose:(heptosyl)LPS alpha-1,3-glucosyltransferase
MRLGVLLDRFDPAAGGAETHTDALLRRAVEKEGGAALACLEGEPPPGVDRVAVEAPAGRPARDRALATTGERRLREAGCDVVLAVRHATACDVYLPHGGLVEDAWAARDRSRGGVGVFARIARRFSAKRGFFLEAERALLGGPHGPRVIAVSQGVAMRIATRYPPAKPRTTVVPNGVDSDRFDPAAVPGERAATRRRLRVPEIAYVGLLLANDPWLKGVGTALEAMARSEVASLEPPFYLVVAGKRADAAVFRRASRLGVEGRVRLAKATPDPRPLYAAADVLVHPTFHDPCSLVCLEALSMALPVVTTPQNGAWEAMGMRGGIAVEDATDAAGVAVALKVLADPLLRSQTSDDARYVARKTRLVTRLDQVLDVCRAAARAR